MRGGTFFMSMRHSPVPSLRLMVSSLRTLARSVRDLGITSDLPSDLIKPIRLSNAVASVGFLMMMTWALFEIFAGNAEGLGWELGLALGFVITPLLNALGCSRAARIALLLVS